MECFFAFPIPHPPPFHFSLGKVLPWASVADVLVVHKVQPFLPVLLSD